MHVSRPRTRGDNFVVYVTDVSILKPRVTQGWAVETTPPVLTSGFNRLKPPWSICQKVVNTGQYESEWSIENFKGRFCG